MRTACPSGENVYVSIDQERLRRHEGEAGAVGTDHEQLIRPGGRNPTGEGDPRAVERPPRVRVVVGAGHDRAWPCRSR